MSKEMWNGNRNAKRVMGKYGKNKNFVICIEIFPESYFLMYIYFFVYFYSYFLKNIYKMNYLQNVQA